MLLAAAADEDGAVFLRTNDTAANGSIIDTRVKFSDVTATYVEHTK